MSSRESVDDLLRFWIQFDFGLHVCFVAVDLKFKTYDGSKPTIDIGFL